MVSQLMLLFQIILILWLTKPLPLAVLAQLQATVPPEAKRGCQPMCGSIHIPYPFGMGKKCYMDDRFSITCNNSRPFLSNINLEVREIMLEDGSVSVYSPIITSDDCFTSTSTRGSNKTRLSVNLTGTPFSFSNTRNKFIATGCNNLALITQNDTTIGGCMSICKKDNKDMGEENAGCYGTDCCQSSISESFKVFDPLLGRFMLRSEGDSSSSECLSAFVVEQKWFTTFYEADASSLLPWEHVPAVLDWAKDIEGMCSNGSSCGFNTYCSNATSTFLCYCLIGYEGNPYLPQGCQQCVDSNGKQCHRGCGYTPYGYECYVPGSGNRSRLKFIILGIVGGLIGALLLLVGTWWLNKVVKRRKRIMLKQKFFKRNGGLLLQQQLSSGEGNVEQTKLFTSKELEKATDHYNQNRILGQGGQGTVYKGMLTDGKIVAIKVSKAVDEGKIDQFINEVVILSQINHRNVVKLHGCCLETEVPLLVYEYIPNGTLFQYIHDQNEEFPVTWQMHLRIATEVAGALFYLHSAASIPIYHRDIKSTNILLDDKYRAKVSDFGTSRSIAVDQTHLTTLVQGTFGYLDPEFFQSSQFTEKSDVYSFGVVLVELLTGQKPISSTRSEEGRSLAAYFIVSMKEKRLFDIVDARVVKEGGKEEIMAVATVAKRCLHLNGKKRPTMKEVAMELEAIKGSKQGGFSAIHQNYEEVEYAANELTGPWDVASTSTGSFADNSAAISLDVEPLLFSKS